MHSLPPLYSRTSREAVQIWTITIDGNCYFTTSGQLHGKKTTSLPTVCEAKNVGRANAVTAVDQAVLEAQAKWDKKRKTGYFERVEDIDDNYYIEAMLAKPLKDVKGGVQFSALVQTKYNGARAIGSIDGLTSRKGEAWKTVPHIVTSLESFFAANPEAVLDGELFNEALRQSLNELMSVVKRKKITVADLARSERTALYYIYDGYGFNGTTEETPYSIRKFHLDELINSGALGPYARLVETTLVKTEAEMWAIYQRLVDDQHEGAIVRYADNHYWHKRVSQLIKLKPEDDSEGIIVAIAEGTGNWAGCGKVISLTWNGKQFDASFKGTMEQARQFLAEKHQWIGRQVTFCYNGLTGLGTPNFARVDINNCLKS